MADVYAPIPVKTKTSGDIANNMAQVGGTNVDTNSGNKSAGTQRVVIATDQPALTNALKVDLGSTTANATAVKVDGSAVTQPVSFGLTGTTTTDYTTSSALAAGSTVNIDSTNIASGTGHLVSVLVGASVPLRCRIGTWDGTTFTVKAVVWTQASQSFLYVPVRNDSITKATGATAKFRVEVLNNDNANAADVYVTTEYYYA